MSLVRSGVTAYSVFARRKGSLGKRALIRVLVVFGEQPSKELSMQLRGVLIIDGDLGGVEGLDQATDQVENLRLVIRFYQPRELRP